MSTGFPCSREFAAEPADIDASCSHLDLSGNKLSGALPAATLVGAQLRLEFITSSYCTVIVTPTTLECELAS